MMKKKWNEKTKKIAVVAGLAAVGILAVTGIAFCIHRDSPEKVELVETKKPEDIVDIPEENMSVPAKDDTLQPVDDEIVIFSGVTETPELENTYVQSLQPTPVKTEDQKPEEALEEESAEQTGAGKPASTKQQTAKPSETPPAAEEPDTPKHGDIQGDKIYVDGFGWVDYNGGETIGIPAHDIYENGNKIGIMD